MARDTQAVKIVSRWAEDAPGNVEAIPEALRLDGWDEQYSQVGGKAGPERTYVNQLLRELSALCAELNRLGPFLPYSPAINYVHPAFIMGTDGNIYVSVADSGPATADAIDPVEDTDNSRWVIY